MNHILTFKVVYLYNGCKRSIFIDTTMDLDMLNLDEMESFLRQGNMFKFDTILTWNYVEIVGIIEGPKEDDMQRLKREEQEELLNAGNNETLIKAIKQKYSIKEKNLKKKKSKEKPIPNLKYGKRKTDSFSMPTENK